MRLLKCPKCGEMFSETYKACPFCQEDEEKHSGKSSRPGHRTGGGRAKPKVGGGVVAACLVLVLGLVAYTVYGSQITAFFTGNKSQAEPAPAALALNQISVDMTVGNSVLLSATGAENIEFSSGDESVATVAEDGTLQAVGVGTTVVTAKSGDQSATCRVTVAEPLLPETPTQPAAESSEAKDLRIYSVLGGNAVDDVTISVGVEAPMRVDGTEAAVAWSIADTSVATVDGSGTVTGVASGKTTLTATVGGQTLTCTIRVG